MNTEKEGTMRVKIGLLALYGFLSLASHSSAAVSRGDSTFIVDPIGEEGYAALAQFLDYDQGIALAPRTVEKEDLEFCTREKVVFTGSHGERVPGYLAFPKDRSGPFPVVLQIHGLSEAWS
jgi:dipeptidyl aminopeptidase/acylaminoacyl peptidase